MNILLLDQFSDLGGAQLCLLDLLPGILARGWHPVVAAPASGAMLDRARRLGAAVENISCGPYTSSQKTLSDVVRFAGDVPRLMSQIRTLIKRHCIDLLYINGPRLVPAAVWAARRTIPVVFHCHSYVPYPYGTLLVGIPLARARATVISSSRFTADSIKQHVPPALLHIVYNGVADLARPRTHAGAKYRIGVIGRIAPQKGQLLFVRAARILLESSPACSFEICGAPLFSDPDATHYDRQVRQTANGMPVEFTGWTDDVPSVLSRLDLLVVPSIVTEATTRVILEAFSAGVPVLAFSAGGIPEVVSHGSTGFLVDRATPEALAEAITSALSKGPEYLARIASAARQEWQSRFTPERYQCEIVDLLGSARARFKASQKCPEQ